MQPFTGGPKYEEMPVVSASGSPPGNIVPCEMASPPGRTTVVSGTPFLQGGIPTALLITVLITQPDAS